MKNILALNNDGFGCRLAAMLNGIKISQAFGENFYFKWDWKRDNIYHAVEPMEYIFSQDFIKKYHIKNSFEDPIGSYKNFFEDYENFGNFRAYVQNKEFINYCKKYNLESRWNSFSYKQAFDLIGFSKKYKNIINKIYSLNLENTIAIHLRGGDIVYAGFNKRVSLVVKTTPLPIAIELISKFESEDVVFIVQDVEIEEFLKQNYNAKVVSSFYEDYYDKYEKAFFDMMFMSQCKKIIASHSGFSISASYIGENEIISYKDIINLHDLCKITKSYYLNIAPYIKQKIPDQYISFDALSLLIYGKKYLTKDEYIYWCKYGFEHNKENSTFLLLQVFSHYAFDECDLADNIIKRELSNSNSFKRLILSIQTNYYARFQLSRDTYFDAFVINCKKRTYGFFLYCIFMIEFHSKDNRALDEFFIGENLSKIDFEILITDLCLEARIYLKYFFNFFTVSHRAVVDEKNQEIDSKNTHIQNLNNTLNEITKEKDQCILNKDNLINNQADKIKFLQKNIKENSTQLNQIQTKLSFQTKYGTAKTRIQNQLSYKLGQAMIVNSKSILGYIRMPFVLSYIKDKHKQEQKNYQEKIKKDPSLALPLLEDYPDYKEALKEKECLTYKLGEALIQANKTWYKGGYVKLWFEIRKLKRYNR
ncbi:hypothetical protein UPTC5044_0300 [Campylobacter lari]|uniref:hypothetical protein n=1 Tax=Campylobacter lari TaxID=201 RepID=UPI00397AF062